ncbi:MULTISPECIES: pseudouridine synthase [unclassified Lysobacter]|uniref:pseudouridine synthase n=1 Tax=unclassified Lysobacter TaxID=2635362 RepID=UPI0006F1FB15|nr:MULTISPECIES: pseudouridine synthase [unclassified Lysobacter]KRA19856.1 pseudouridine synthase [Lysobacter sp. Root604]KRD38870.1 pseudouridine synthase [Lysobacter sp. Root916]
MTTSPRHGLARVLSKQGLCSRSEAARWIAAGRVAVDGRVVRDPEFPIASAPRARPRIAVDGRDIDQAARLYLMLNKPRGLVTSARDERGRDTVYRCFDGALWQGAPLPWLAPVGRLDQASEGLLLFCNDPEWAARITDPEHGPDKTYHVQIDTIPDDETLAALVAGVIEEGVALRAKSARLLRSGEKNAWLEIVLDEGRNRQIRRLLAAFDIGVLRLLRVAIGELVLGELGKGQWRMLGASEIAQLSR